MSESTEFRVSVNREKDGSYCVEINEADGSEYAKVWCSNVDDALRMAVPYMASVVDPVPGQLLRLLRERSPEAK